MPTIVQYNGEVIASLVQAQKATLHCANETMVTDIVVETEVLNLQEKTVTESGEYTADDGYDALSKVTVLVGSGGGAVVVAAVKRLTLLSAEVLAEDTTLMIG